METRRPADFFNKNQILLLAVAGLLVIGGLLWFFLHNGSSGTRKPLTGHLKGLPSQIQKDLAGTDAEELFSDRPRRAIIIEGLKDFYGRRQFHPVWITEKGLAQETDSALNILVCSYSEGLEPGNYAAKELSLWRDSIAHAGIDKLPLTFLAKFETSLSANLFQYATHITTGRINPSSLDTTWKFEPQKFDVAAFFDSTPAADLPHAIGRLLPNTADYLALRTELGRYRAAAHKEWPQINASQIDSGLTGPAVLALNQRLHAAGLLDSNTAKTDRYGPITSLAVRMFYIDNGMFSKGYANKEVIDLLNKPSSYWIRLCELNLERRRWIGKLPDHHLYVNIPEYRLRAMENDKPVLDMEVVVGDEYHITPVFSGKLQYCIFNPEWIITDNIARHEVLKVLQRNPNFINHDSIKVLSSWKDDAVEVDPTTIDWNKFSVDTFPFKLVQRPGPRNPLGHIKFIFPNDKSVYLHDTPFKWAFDKKVRDFSHGCIRLQSPLKLATYLLKDNPVAESDSIKAILTSGRQRQIDFEEPIPVYLVYLTAWVDDKGRLNHRQDLYGHDARHIEAIYEKEQKLMAKR